MKNAEKNTKLKEEAVFAFPRDEEGKIIRTVYLKPDGTKYEETPNKAPYVFIGGPTVVRECSLEEIKVITENLGSIFQSEHLWEVSGLPEEIKLYVTDGTSISTKAGWADSGVTRSFHTRVCAGKGEEIKSKLIIFESNIEADTLSIGRPSIIHKSFIRAGYLTIEDSEVSKSEVYTSETFSVHSGRVVDVEVEGPCYVNGSSIVNSKLYSKNLAGFVINNSQMTDSSIDTTHANLSTKIENRRVHSFTYNGRRLGDNHSCMTTFYIGERVHYGYFSGIDRISFMALSDGTLYVNGHLFKLEDFNPTTMFGQMVKEETPSTRDKAIEIIFGNSSFPNDEHTKALVDNLLAQINSRLKLISTLRSIKGGYGADIPVAIY